MKTAPPPASHPSPRGLPTLRAKPPSAATPRAPRQEFIEPLESRIAPAAVAVLDLSTLDGANGFKIQGEAESDFSGASVSAAGDINGDGFDDIIIGALGADPNGTNSGASYVVFGKAGGFSATLNLSTLNGTNGFKIQGEAAFDSSGRSVSAAGDINGDGFDDILIGADGAGASYVVFGKAGGFSATLNLSTLNGANGFKIQGEAASDFAGRSVSAAGDINGDGFDDILIGAYGADSNGTNSGASYVVFGKAGGFSATLNLSALDGSNGFKIPGEAASDFAGRSVSAAGDINGDGFDDILIGAFGADPNGNHSGASYVVFGKAGGFSATLNLSTLNGANGFKIQGEAASDSSGRSVSAAGDINGDGFDDILIGAYGADSNGTDSGASYVVFGKAGGFSATLNLSTLNGANGFKIQGEAAFDSSGRSVSAAGDIDGDGFDDILIGAFGADPNGTNSGASFVVFGKAGGFSATLNLSTLDGTNGFKIQGEAASDSSGGSVSAAGDINGDGFDDILIGAYGADPNGSYSGASYVVFGRGTADVTVAANGKSATFIDWDGDLVTIKASKGILDAGQFKLSSPNPATGGSHLIYVDFTEATTGNEFTGANLSFSAKRGADGGDGLVNVGTIDARGVDLGKVTVDGDLQQLDANAAARLKVFSLGQFAEAEVQGAPLTSEITGKLGALNVLTDASRVTISAQTIGAIKALNFDGVSILASGVLNPTTAKNALAIASISLGGSIQDSQILAGYDAGGAAVNADVQIGKVSIKGQWVASDLVAGVRAGADGIFGTSDDALIAGGNSILSRIASVVIRGAAFGTVDAIRDGFGIVAQQIGSLKTGRATVPLEPGAGNDTTPLLLGVTGDFRVREVA
jgi:hypothetical protein